MFSPFSVIPPVPSVFQKFTPEGLLTYTNKPQIDAAYSEALRRVKPLRAGYVISDSKKGDVDIVLEAIEPELQSLRAAGVLTEMCEDKLFIQAMQQHVKTLHRAGSLSDEKYTNIRLQVAEHDAQKRLAKTTDLLQRLEDFEAAHTKSLTDEEEHFDWSPVRVLVCEVYDFFRGFFSRDYARPTLPSAKKPGLNHSKMFLLMAEKKLREDLLNLRYSDVTQRLEPLPVTEFIDAQYGATRTVSEANKAEYDLVLELSKRKLHSIMDEADRLINDGLYRERTFSFSGKLNSFEQALTDLYGDDGLDSESGEVTRQILLQHYTDMRQDRVRLLDRVTEDERAYAKFIHGDSPGVFKLDRSVVIELALITAGDDLRTQALDSPSFLLSQLGEMKRDLIRVIYNLGEGIEEFTKVDAILAFRSLC